MLQLIINEWRQLIRSKNFLILVSFCSALLILTVFLGIEELRIQSTKRDSAQTSVRAQWENMGPSNPHGAAHLGTYAFKPSSILNAIEPGVESVVGRVLRLEGHVQNETVHSADSQAIMRSRFGVLKPALILQLIIPVLLIFLSFNAVNSEKEEGRLKLLLLQGLKARQLLFGKIFSYWLIGTLLLLITFLSFFLFFDLIETADFLIRASLLFTAYALYYFVIIGFTVLFSSYFKNNTASLTIMLALWILWSVFIPKITAETAEISNPLPSRQAMKTTMKEDRAKGIDGHNPNDERKKQLKDSVLNAYQVDKLEDLPINYDGLVMQADEEYGNKVWDKHFGDLHNLMNQQKKLYQWSGIINPFQSLKNLSMGFSGTDNFHHLEFQKESEVYRRVFIKKLNDEHAYGGSKTGDWGWKAEQEFFNSIKDFQYETPSFLKMKDFYLTDIILLTLWVLVTLLCTYALAPKLKVT